MNSTGPRKLNQRNGRVRRRVRGNEPLAGIERTKVMKYKLLIILSALTFILISSITAFGQNSSPPLPPIAFEKAMVFIDGTNLFYRLMAAKLSLNVNFTQIIQSFLKRRQLWRVYLYTIEQHLTQAKQFHKDFITDGIRVVLGEGVPTQDGNVREKGVDALL